MAGIYPESGVPANQALNSVDVDSTNCGSGELFHSTSRCTPRFDPAAANAVMSEILNVVAKKCDGTDATQAYDCSRLDNLLNAICRHWDEQWLECFETELPEANEVCGDVRYLTLVDDGTCTRFATYASNDPAVGDGTFGEAQPHLPRNQPGFRIPDDFQNPTNYYNVNDIETDWNAGGANGIDDGRIENSKVAEGMVTLACETRVTLRSGVFHVQPGNVQTAFDQRYRFGFRWRTNGGQWEYQQIANGSMAFLAESNAVERFGEWEITRTFPAGTTEVQVYYLAEQTDNVVLIANTNDFGGASGSPFPFVTIRQAI